MRKLGTMFLCASLFTLLVGCSDYSSMRDEVQANNQRVTMVRDNYKASKDAGASLDREVRNSLLTGSVTKLTAIGVSEKDFLVTIKPSVVSMSEAISSYIDNANQRAKDNGSESTVKSRDALLANSFSVHYFIDDKTGKVEQMFLVQLPNGFAGRLSVYWQGGRYLESKTFGSI